MDSANPERTRPETSPEHRSAPVAQISRGALIGNARLIAATGIREYSAGLLRADAWGHGAQRVAAVLEAEGIHRAADAVRRPDAAADAVTMTPSPELDPRSLFGLPGGSLSTTPVMRFTGTVVGTKNLRGGEGVSYGYSYRARADTRIALVTGGYAQGVVRALGNRAAVVAGGRRHPIIGRIAMDVCVVEIGDAVLGRGDALVFFGDSARDEPSIDEWVSPTGLRPAELVAAVGLHATRVEVA